MSKIGGGGSTPDPSPSNTGVIHGEAYLTRKELLQYRNSSLPNTTKFAHDITKVYSSHPLTREEACLMGVMPPNKAMTEKEYLIATERYD